MAMLRTQVYLEEEQSQALKLLAASSSMNFSELIREGADMAIKKHNSKINKKFGEGIIGIANHDLGGKTGTEIINEYYENFGR